MFKIKHLLVVLPMLLAASSCGPYTAQLNLRQMGKSPSTIDFSAKSLSLWYSYHTPEDSALVHSFSQQFADEMAAAYGVDLDIYARKAIQGVCLSSRDSMVNMLMVSGTDVVLFVESGGLSYTGSSFMRVDVYIYDSMNKIDKVFARPDVEFVKGSEKYQVQNLMALLGPEWSELNLKVVYYDYSRWIDAVSKMYSLDLKGSLDIFLAILSDKPGTSMKQAAEYDIALICYLMGEKALAKEWLDRSVSDLNGGEEPAYIRSLRRKLK